MVNVSSTNCITCDLDSTGKFKFFKLDEDVFKQDPTTLFMCSNTSIHIEQLGTDNILAIYTC